MTRYLNFFGTITKKLTKAQIASGEWKAVPWADLKGKDRKRRQTMAVGLGLKHPGPNGAALAALEGQERKDAQKASDAAKADRIAKAKEA